MVPLMNIWMPWMYQRCTNTLSKWNVWQQVLCFPAVSKNLNERAVHQIRHVPGVHTLRCVFSQVSEPHLSGAAGSPPSACTLCARRASPKTCPLPSVRDHRSLPEVIDYMLHVWLCSSSSRYSVLIHSSILISHYNQKMKLVLFTIL